MKKAIIFILVAAVFVTFVGMYQKSQQQFNPDVLLATPRGGGILAKEESATKVQEADLETETTASATEEELAEKEEANQTAEETTEAPEGTPTTTPDQEATETTEESEGSTEEELVAPEPEPGDAITQQYALFSPSSMLIGYNSEGMMEHFGNDPVPESVVAKINELAPDMLRFPGGTVSNLYDIDLPGYGQNTPTDAQFQENHIVRFIDMVKRLNPEPKMNLVLSAQRHFPNQLTNPAIFDDNKRLIEAFLDADIEVASVSCGNEMYLKNEVVGIFKWHWPTVASNTDKYINVCRQYRDIVKELDPSIDFLAPWGNVRNQTQFFWDLRLIQNGLDVFDGFDAHVYGLIPDSCINADGSTNLSCAEEGILTYLSQREEEFAWINQNTDKQIHVHEWNGVFFREHAASFADLQNSDFQREMNLTFLEMFRQQGVASALHHRLSGYTSRRAYNVFSYPPTNPSLIEEEYAFSDFNALQQ